MDPWKGLRLYLESRPCGMAASSTHINAFRPSPSTNCQQTSDLLPNHHSSRFALTPIFPVRSDLRAAVRTLATSSTDRQSSASHIYYKQTSSSALGQQTRLEPRIATTSAFDDRRPHNHPLEPLHQLTALDIGHSQQQSPLSHGAYCCSCTVSACQ